MNPVAATKRNTEVLTQREEFLQPTEAAYEQYFGTHELSEFRIHTLN